MSDDSDLIDPAIDEDEDGGEGGVGLAPVTVAVLHPDESRRALLARKLERSEGIEVVISEGDTDEGVTAVIDSLPDVVAIYPSENLVDLVARVEHEAPAVSVLVLDPGPEHFD